MYIRCPRVYVMVIGRSPSFFFSSSLQAGVVERTGSLPFRFEADEVHFERRRFSAARAKAAAAVDAMHRARAGNDGEATSPDGKKGPLPPPRRQPRPTCERAGGIGICSGLSPLLNSESSLSLCSLRDPHSHLSHPTFTHQTHLPPPSLLPAPA